MTNTKFPQLFPATSKGYIEAREYLKKNNKMEEFYEERISNILNSSGDFYYLIKYANKLLTEESS